MADYMDEATYVGAQKQIELFSGLIKGLPLDRGEMAGFIHDPTLYREALQSGKLELVRDVTKALAHARHEIMKAEKRFEDLSKPGVR